MTPEQKQQKLREWLPEIAKACGFYGAYVTFNGVCSYPDVNGQYITEQGPVSQFDPVDDDRDSALVRRVLGVDVCWLSDAVFDVDSVDASYSIFYDRITIVEPHDGTPESMGAAERWAVIQAATKKLGLE